MTKNSIEPVEMNVFTRLLVIYSPAGGNGKSEIAANLGNSLANCGKRIWIVDANTYSPTLDIIFNISDIGDSLLSFMSSPTIEDLPMHQIISTPATPNSSLYLTPSGQGGREFRRDIFTKVTINSDFIERIQNAIYRNISRNYIDICIIDTHPGFDLMNNFWFALTQYILVVSRMNDMDIRNLAIQLQDINIADIKEKLVLFNNVQRKESEITWDLENEEMVERFRRLIKGDELKKQISGSLTCNGNLCGTVEFYPDPFLYSQQLSLFQQNGDRESLFTKIKPDDLFSRRISELSSFLLQKFV